MIVMVSTKTLSAREPGPEGEHEAERDHVEAAAREHVVDRRLDDLVDRALGERLPDRSMTAWPHVSTCAGAELVGDEADQARHREDQRRHREHREERRLGRQAGHPVAHAASRPW